MSTYPQPIGHVAGRAPSESGGDIDGSTTRIPPKVAGQPRPEPGRRDRCPGTNFDVDGGTGLIAAGRMGLFGGQDTPQDDVAVGTSHPERTDGRASTGGELLGFTADLEPCCGQIDQGVWCGEVGLWIYLSAPHHQHGLDQAHDASGRVEMPVTGFERPEVARRVPFRP